MNQLPQNLLTYKNTIKTQLSLDLCSAGRWTFDTDGSKKAIDPYRATYSTLEQYPNDNMFKIFLEGEALVIDVDNKPREDVEELYPTIKDTLYTTTTKPEKGHYYVLPPEG